MGLKIIWDQGLTNNAAIKISEELEKLEIELLLEGIYRHYGFDFRTYSFSFLRRRIWNRVQNEGLKNISALQARVLHEPDIMEKLLGDFSINLTEMFRDPDFFLSFRLKVVPYLRELPLIRIWHAGCSTGEEVFSMAILLQEEGLYNKTMIYATDIHEKSLTKAKQAIFPLEKMQKYTKNYLASGGTGAFSEYYSVNNEKGVVFDPALSENIVFAHHNLAIDRSFNEFHVIICRNVLIYFNKELQNHVYNLFYQSLTRGGFLGLGSKEDMKYSGWDEYFETVDASEKIYKKII